DIAHELIALAPGVASQHAQFPLVGREAEHRVEGGGLACAVGTDEPQDAALFHPHIDAVQRDGRAEGLAQAPGFYACHGFSAPLSCGGPTRRFSTARHPKMTRCLHRPAVLPPSGRAAEWSHRPSAILLPETSAVRLAATCCGRRR